MDKITEITLTQEELKELCDRMNGALRINPKYLIVPDPFVIEGPSEYNPRPFESDIPDDDKKSCPDCKGTGEYAGILVVEKCQHCKGTGLI